MINEEGIEVGDLHDSHWELPYWPFWGFLWKKFSLNSNLEVFKRNLVVQQHPWVLSFFYMREQIKSHMTYCPLSQQGTRRAEKGALVRFQYCSGAFWMPQKIIKCISLRHFRSSPSWEAYYFEKFKKKYPGGGIYLFLIKT